MMEQIAPTIVLENYLYQKCYRDIQYIGSPFWILPSSFANSKFAASEVLKETYKVTQEVEILLNLKLFLKKKILSMG